MKKSKAKLLLLSNSGSQISEGSAALNIIGKAPATDAVIPDEFESVPGTFRKRLDELSDDQLETFSEDFRLATLMEQGLTAAQAKKRTGSNRSRRSVQDVYDRFRKKGVERLPDKRWFRKPEVTVMLKDVTDIALAWYFERPAASYRAIAELTAESCGKRGLPVPSESSIKRFLCMLPEGVKLARKGRQGFKVWQQQMASVVEQEKTTFANELWQGDGTPSRIWIKKKVRGSWTAVPVYLAAFIDDYSRACPGFIVSTKHYDSWTIAILSRFSMMKKDDPNRLVSGRPFFIETDQGKEYSSGSIQTSWRSIGINAVADPPYYPNLKGKIERWFQHLDTNCLRKLPGHHDAIGCTQGAAQKKVHELLTLKQLREEITYWIVNRYHQKKHTETGRKPIELWEETVKYRPVKNEEDLNILLLKYDRERTILNCGIRLVINEEKHRYWAPEFDRLGKRRVRIRYNPEDTDSILLYCAESGEFLCEAWDSRAQEPKYSYQDVKLARFQEKQYLRGIQARNKEYYRNVLSNDRLVEQEKEWEVAREAVKEMPFASADASANTALTDTNETTDQSVQDLVKAMRERNRRRD